jgi:hypothetical protein
MKIDCIDTIGGGTGMIAVLIRYYKLIHLAMLVLFVIQVVKHGLLFAIVFMAKLVATLVFSGVAGTLIWPILCLLGSVLLVFLTPLIVILAISLILGLLHAF